MLTVLSCKKGNKRLFCGGTALAFMSALTLFFVIKYPDVTIDNVQRGLDLCVGVIIPSLFPFMVASELIVSSGVVAYISNPLGIVSRPLFGVGGVGAGAFLLGAVCGFPVGTRTAVSLYKRGEISFDELSRLVCFSNNPSSAFVISAVGMTLFGSRKLGIALYFITLFSSILVGVIQNILLGRTKEKGISTKSDLAIAGRGLSVFAGAISSSAFSMVGICGFVVFFSAFTGVLGEIMSCFQMSDICRAAIFSFFELTVGVASSACVRPVGIAVLIAAFAVGWSGISVHFQMLSICDGLPVSFGRYFASKLLQGMLNVTLVWWYLKTFGDRLVFDTKSVGVFSLFSEEAHGVGAVVSVVFFIILSLALFKRILKK